MAKHRQLQDFPSQIARNCHKSLVTKLIWHDNWEKSVKISLCHRFAGFADFVEKSLLAFFFLLQLLNSFPRVCLSPLCEAILKFFLQLTTCAISITAYSIKSAPARFTAGNTFLRKNGIAVLQISYTSALNHRPRCRLIPLWIGISIWLEATTLQRLSC